ncbi:MAG: hypothetical protein H6601_09915 [Flavobacteriales bacterium]|nr:hypothetical protein [Flavobacteriales bacterium]
MKNIFIKPLHIPKAVVVLQPVSRKWFFNNSRNNGSKLTRWAFYTDSMISENIFSEVLSELKTLLLLPTHLRKQGLKRGETRSEIEFVL